MDFLVILLTILIFVSWLYFFFESFAIFFWINKQGCSVSFFYSSMPGIVIRKYYGWCKVNDKAINFERVKRYDRALKVFGYSFILVFILIILSAVI